MLAKPNGKLALGSFRLYNHLLDDFVNSLGPEGMKYIRQQNFDGK